MIEDDELRRQFDRVGFAGEPPMGSTATDDLVRGRRHLRRRRIATLGGGALGVAAAGVGVALLLPGFGPAASSDLDVAGAGPAPVEVTDETAPATHETGVPSQEPSQEPTVDDEYQLGFPLTRQLLLDTAVEHLDPAHEHLPAESTGLTGGGTNVGTKLEWLVDGDDGMGLVQVAVTGPGYADEYEFARQDFAANIGCEIDTDRCIEQPIPGTDETALVGAANPDTHLLFSIVYERADGSFVGIAVSDLFGNNSLIPLAEMDVSLEQGFAFVTDPDLALAPGESAEDYDVLRPGEREDGSIPEGTSEEPVD
ncbi:hypothetical protein E1212_09310 [Jiangella ureilytica]|uniref:Uncharacterized protein n=1 Tax=Jiangella ureilytica TaxID=2530374 RepID=A0A4R4RRN2_9ACTN|nr:hypothetical protein [Jiangella ureilytica]TDC52246.1 hypothetical protein E1212_09310 [Jiangella ureilytica]